MPIFWWNFQLEVAVFDVGLTELEKRSLLHEAAQSAVGAVGSDDQISTVSLNFLRL